MGDCMIPPLAIVQARMASTRLPNKMLLDLGGKPLVQWAWDAAREAFGTPNTVVAIPSGPANDQLASVVADFGGTVFRWAGDEDDVLGRFMACAHTYRWHPAAVIVRVTADDPFKLPDLMRRVAQGERHPVELGAEAFTLEMLTAADSRYHPSMDAWAREHITHALFDTKPPPPPPGIWTIDTYADLDAARKQLAKGKPER